MYFIIGSLYERFRGQPSGRSAFETHCGSRREEAVVYFYAINVINVFLIKYTIIICKIHTPRPHTACATGADIKRPVVIDPQPWWCLRPIVLLYIAAYYYYRYYYYSRRCCCCRRNSRTRRKSNFFFRSAPKLVSPKPFHIMRRCGGGIMIMIIIHVVRVCVQDWCSRWHLRYRCVVLIRLYNIIIAVTFGTKNDRNHTYG